jgi:hypothetical protein
LFAFDAAKRIRKFSTSGASIICPLPLRREYAEGMPLA